MCMSFMVMLFGWKDWVWGGTASGCTVENCMAGWLASEKTQAREQHALSREQVPAGDMRAMELWLFS